LSLAPRYPPLLLELVTRSTLNETTRCVFSVPCFSVPWFSVLRVDWRLQTSAGSARRTTHRASEQTLRGSKSQTQRM